MPTLQREIEEQLAEREPEVEVLLAEVVGGGTLRVFIDHPDGVTLVLCERVTAALAELRERYSLEVSSPGPERPLSKPEHFRRFVGRRARVRTRGDQPSLSSRQPSPAGRPSPPGCVPLIDRQPSGGRATSRRSYTGELVGASDTEITLAADGALVTIPYAQIRRSNLVEE
ncbi:MAG: ribosome maturation factor RimP [Solirubrobacteraceae bacterium]